MKARRTPHGTASGRVVPMSRRALKANDHPRLVGLAACAKSAKHARSYRVHQVLCWQLPPSGLTPCASLPCSSEGTIESPWWKESRPGLRFKISTKPNATDSLVFNTASSSD